MKLNSIRGERESEEEKRFHARVGNSAFIFSQSKKNCLNEPSNDSNLHSWLNGHIEILQSWSRIHVVVERHVFEFNQTLMNRKRGKGK